MFERPEDEALYGDIDERRQSWFRRLRHAHIGLVGGGLECLAAGVVLENEDVSTLILTEHSHPAHRMLDETGPVPIFPPAVQRLEEWGYPVEENPPIWPDRTDLYSFLIHSYVQAGGLTLRRISLENSNVDDKEIELTVSLGDRRETFRFDDVILGVGEYGIEESDLDTSDPLEYEVLGTRRRSDGAVQAGPVVLPDRLAETALPLESAHVLSGRKAAEIVLSEHD
jgi:hypothetical protein